MTNDLVRRPRASSSLTFLSSLPGLKHLSKGSGLRGQGQVDGLLAEHPCVQMHLTLTYSSWLNQGKLWFAKVERGTIARGVFTSNPLEGLLPRGTSP